MTMLNFTISLKIWLTQRRINALNGAVKTMFGVIVTCNAGKVPAWVFVRKEETSGQQIVCTSTKNVAHYEERRRS